LAAVIVVVATTVSKESGSDLLVAYGVLPDIREPLNAALRALFS
jgi:hypothetical protein